MSDHLYPTRLWFENGRGTAKHDGVAHALSAAPVISGLPPIEAIDYAPGVVAQLRPQRQAMRDITPDEAARVLAWLMALG